MLQLHSTKKVFKLQLLTQKKTPPEQDEGGRAHYADAHSKKQHEFDKCVWGCSRKKQEIPPGHSF